MGCITAVWIISRFPSGTIYSYHGYFRFSSGFMPVYVKLYGSLMAHGYGSEKPRVVTARFNRGSSAVMYRGFETVKSPAKIRLHGRRGKGMAESFSREKLRHAPEKEGG